MTIEFLSCSFERTNDCYIKQIKVKHFMSFYCSLLTEYQYCINTSLEYQYCKNVDNFMTNLFIGF